MALRLDEIVARFGGEIVGAGDTVISRIGTLEQAGPGDLAFLANPRYRHQLATTRASAVIMAPPVFAGLAAAILTPQPYLYYARVAQWLSPPLVAAAGIHPSAVVEGEVAASASVGPNVWVGSGAVIGDDVIIGANCSIGAGVTLGPGSRLAANVAIYADCRLGARCLVHSAAVIGADGFGFARDEDGRYHKFPQVGIVVVEDDVEIGALTAIDRAALGETRIGRGSKLDNLVQVGHSVTIGEDTVLAGQVGVAGSTRIGRRVTLAGQVGVAGHLEIGDGVVATAQTGIPGSVEAGAIVSGYPAIENRAWLKSSALFAKLPELQRRLRELERRLESLLSPSRDGSSSGR